MMQKLLVMVLNSSLPPFLLLSLPSTILTIIVKSAHFLRPSPRLRMLGIKCLFVLLKQQHRRPRILDTRMMTLLYLHPK